MGKKLSEMTLEELWALFPIVLTEHNDGWTRQYEEEREYLASFLPSSVRFYHIGSTAIKDIWAKPIVDILIETPRTIDLREIKDALVSRGYIVMSESADRVSLNKGYTEQGFAEKVFHLHVRYPNDKAEVVFRDYLNAEPSVAKEYERLKLGLWKRYERDRDAYTNAKTAFVEKCLTDALNKGYRF